MSRLSPTILLSIFLCALSLAGCALPAEGPESRDLSSAIQIPHMSAKPTFDKQMTEGEWDETVQVNGSFTIADGSVADGTYPFRLWIGATDDGLLIAAEVQNETGNPFSNENERWADALFLFFDTDEGPNLTRPSYMLSGFTEGGSTWTDHGFWNGKEWEGDPTAEGARMDAEYRPHKGSVVRAGPGEGTTLFEIFTPRIPTHSIRNSLHLTAGAEFRMGLAYMRGGGAEEESYSRDARGKFLWPHDAYPGEGYNPNGMYHPADWLRFRMP